VYIAGTRCIAQRGKSPFGGEGSSDWLQRKIAENPPSSSGAASGSGRATKMWVGRTQDWRKIYMQRVRQIASAAIDRIYVDIPYWMTHAIHYEVCAALRKNRWKILTNSERFRRTHFPSGSVYPGRRLPFVKRNSRKSDNAVIHIHKWAEATVECDVCQCMGSWMCCPEPVR
jgi:hypothetical protein